MPVESLLHFFTTIVCILFMQSYADNLGQKHGEDSPQNYFNLLVFHHLICQFTLSMLTNMQEKNKMKYITIVRCLLDVKQ